MLNWLGMTEVVALELRPGVPASVGYLAQVLQTLNTRPVRFCLSAPRTRIRARRFSSTSAHVPAVTLPFTIGGTPGATNLFTPR